MGAYVAVPLAAIGTKIQLGDGASTENFTTVALVGDISGPDKSRTTIDVTNHNNPDHYSEFIGGLKDANEISFPVFFDPAEPTHITGAVSLNAAFEDGLRHSVRILIPGATSADQYAWNMKGIVTKLSFKSPVNGAQQADCSIKISGKATLTKMTTPVV